MFVRKSNVTIAAENYSDVIEYPIDQISRKQSIASYNFPQKTMFFSHINKIVEEPMSPEFRLVRMTAMNARGDMYTVVCDDETEVAIARGRFTTFAKIHELRQSSSILIDTFGFMCKIIRIEPHYDSEFQVYDVKSNKGSTKFVNGIMFKA